ncbi:MAG: hypothetical protein IT169_08890 [Bryobacterales bacterium]|nr:hypothetical protein [Bryobacterales bacterium]
MEHRDGATFPYTPGTNGMVEFEHADDTVLARRDLLKGGGTVAGFLAAANYAAAQPAPASGLMPEAKAGPPLPLADFGKYRITRLIAGALAL